MPVTSHVDARLAVGEHCLDGVSTARRFGAGWGGAGQVWVWVDAGHRGLLCMIVHPGIVCDMLAKME